MADAAEQHDDDNVVDMTQPTAAEEIDLESLDLAALKDLSKRIDRQLVETERRQRAEAQQEIEEVARRHGFNARDLFGNPSKAPAGPSRGKAPAKYRDAAGNTWSGRGRQPRWFKEALEDGADPEDFLIK